MNIQPKNYNKYFEHKSIYTNCRQVNDRTELCFISLRIYQYLSDNWLAALNDLNFYLVQNSNYQKIRLKWDSFLKWSSMWESFAIILLWISTMNMHHFVGWNYHPHSDLMNDKKSIFFYNNFSDRCISFPFIRKQITNKKILNGWVSGRFSMQNWFLQKLNITSIILYIYLDSHLYTQINIH